MTPLQTLRSSCIDGQNLIEYNMVEHADEQEGTTALTVATYAKALVSGFYLLSGLTFLEFKFNNALSSGLKYTLGQWPSRKHNRELVSSHYRD
jgi:hypothetical protein